MCSGMNSKWQLKITPKRAHILYIHLYNTSTELIVSLFFFCNSLQCQSGTKNFLYLCHFLCVWVCVSVFTTHTQGKIQEPNDKQLANRCSCRKTIFWMNNELVVWKHSLLLLCRCSGLAWHVQEKKNTEEKTIKHFLVFFISILCFIRLSSFLVFLFF